MPSKFIFPLTAFVLVVIMALYFLINPSYQKSIEAKYYFEIGSYKEAYTLANEAFSMDVYNRMASTIMAQSKISLKYVAYVNRAKRYMKEINIIATHDTISNADRAKMRMICSIMVDSYIKLAPSIITDNDLVDEAAAYFQDFEKLLEKVSR